MNHCRKKISAWHKIYNSFKTGNFAKTKYYSSMLIGNYFRPMKGGTAPTTNL